ncbi:MAG: Gldg family protein [Melioribacteraceae bacterium]|nr:Gldg family protein [Melioribacteraceae bacterium]
MLTRKKVQTTVVLVFGILIMANIISNKFFFRLDFTEDQRYSLSEATKNILENLVDPVTVTAYFSEDLPPNVAKVKSDFKDLLIEYDNLSGGNVVYEFINPNENQAEETKAQQNGISPIMINVRERDQMKQQRAYLGTIVQMGERKEIIPFIQPGAAMEFALSSNIKKLSVQVKPKIVLLQGHGEAKLSTLQQLGTQLNIMYNVQELELNDTTDIPGDVKTIAIIAPKDTVLMPTLDKLDNFLAKGGNLLVALNRVEGNLQQSSGNVLNTGFAEWLNDKGIEIEDKFIVDVKCGNVMVRQQQGMFVMNTPVNFPYLPIISNFADHPISGGLEAVILPFASPITIAPKDTTVSFIPLAMTSEQSDVESAPVFFNIQKEWKTSDFKMGSLPVAVAMEGKIVGDANSKMVVFGDGDFVVNGEGQQAQQQQPDNINLMANAIDWLSDDTGLIELRTKGVSARMLDATLDDSTKTIIKYLNFLLPIIFIILYGVFRSQVKRKIRNKLKQTEYV